MYCSVLPCVRINYDAAEKLATSFAHRYTQIIIIIIIFFTYLLQTSRAPVKVSQSSHRRLLSP